MRRILIALAAAGLAAGLGAAAGGARDTGIVPKRLVGAYDAYFTTPNPTVRAHWVLAIGRHGSFVYTTPLVTLEAVGPVSVEGNTITFPPDVARGGNCSHPGIYTWNLAGKTLTFARVNDDCASRIYRLTKRPWKHFDAYTVVIIIRR